MSTTIPPPTSPVSGSFFIGNILTSILFGVITVQAKLYWDRFPGDHWVVKAMVAFLWFAQLMETLITTGDIYDGLIAIEYRSNRHLKWESAYWATHLVITSFVVQSFFTFRLWALAQRWIYIIALPPLILAGAVVGLVANKNGYTGSPITFSTVVSIASISSAVDLALAFGVVIELRRKRTGFLQTDRMINWLMLYGVASGVVTSVVAIGILAANIVGGGQTVLAAGVALGGVYTVSALAHLHSRTGLRSRLAEEHRLSSPLPSSMEMTTTPHNCRIGTRERERENTTTLLTATELSSQEESFASPPRPCVFGRLVK